MPRRPPENPESTLDRYLTDDEPGLEDFVAEQARRAPWWAISLLVHVIAVLVMWRWPLRPIEAKSRDVPTVVRFHEEWTEDIEPPEREEFPLDPPPEPEELHARLVESFTPRRLDPEPPPGPDLEKLLQAPTGSVPREPIEPVRAPSEAIPVIAVPSRDPGRRTGRIFGPRQIPGGGGGEEPGGGGIHPIKLALYWLARAQERDGSWDASRWDGAQPYRVGSTGLALLAYLGAGYTHTKGPFQGTVGRALRWLAASQRPNGRFPWSTFYEQGIAAMAVCEAAALTRDRQAARMAQRAVDYIVRVQPEHGGFRYRGAVAKGEGDLSVTGWQIMALKSAIATDLRVPAAALERSHQFLASTARRYGTSAYLAGAPKAGSAAMTSVGMVCRIFLDGERYDGDIMAAARHLLEREARDLQAVPGGASHQLVRDLYYTYYSSLGMYQVGGEFWRAWRRMFYGPLVAGQVQKRFDEKGRYVRGSWDPAKARWGKAGGRVYATAMAALSLEVEIRYLQIYRR